jgi:hypothetical protein
MMTRLRDRLQERDAWLYQALMRSWEIAQDEWLPALGASGGSYNSYPHLRNLEAHLDRLIAGFEECPGQSMVVSLRPVEIYIILAAILFHDIGKLKARHGTHGTESGALLKNRWAELGVPSKELGCCLGRVCEYHDCPQDRISSLEDELGTTIVDPYGEIRQLGLACLLKLLDHLDSAYNRVIPEYLLVEFADSQPIRAFRSVISGVYADVRERAVRTALADDISEVLKPQSKTGTEEVRYGDVRFKINEQRVNESAEISCRIGPQPGEGATLLGQEDVAEMLKDLSDEDFLREIGVIAENVHPAGMELPLISRIAAGAMKATPVPPLPPGFGRCEFLVAQQMLRYKKGQDDRWAWTQGMILALVMGDVRKNAEVLKRIRQHLMAMGLPLLAWLIEHKEHLYNPLGQETCEPVLDAAYLRRVAEAMWKLSSRIFGSSYFTYEALADRLRDPDLYRVRLGVRRLCIVTRYEWHGTAAQVRCPIWYGDRSWRWEVMGPCITGKCEFMPLEKIDKVLQSLGRPA